VSGIECQVIDSSLHIGQIDRCKKHEGFLCRLRLDCPKRDGSDQKHARHFAPQLKSSNNVTLSALVQTPILPVSLNVSSSQSIAFLPSNVTVK